MKKISLDLECLDVQSFDTTPRRGPRSGTVLGHGTFGAEESCAPSWCGDCQTNNDPACENGGSGDCPSVNVIGCQSAGYTECCQSNNWTDCCGGGDRSTDPHEFDCS